MTKAHVRSTGGTAFLPRWSLGYSGSTMSYADADNAVVIDEPMIRPTFLDHEADEQCFEACDDFSLGRDLLVANVIEEGVKSRRIYLPDNDVGHYDFWSGTYYEAGQEIEVAVVIASIPLFVRFGCVLALAPDVEKSGSVKGEIRKLVIYPRPSDDSCVFSSDIFEDAVDNVDALDGMHRLTTVSVIQTASTLDVTWVHKGIFAPELAGRKISLSNDDTKRLSV